MGGDEVKRMIKERMARKGMIKSRRTEPEAAKREDVASPPRKRPGTPRRAKRVQRRTRLESPPVGSRLRFLASSSLKAPSAPSPLPAIEAQHLIHRPSGVTVPSVETVCKPARNMRMCQVEAFRP